MKIGRVYVFVIIVLISLFTFSHQALSQGSPEPTPPPNAPTADFTIFLPMVVKQNNNAPQPSASHPRRIDHRSIDFFSRIPDQYLTSARNMKVLFSDRSVGQNVNEALNCLAAPSWADSPAYCRNDYTDSNWNWKTFNQTDLNNGIVPARIQFTPSPVRYNRSNWTYEFRMGTWIELTGEFVNTLGPTYVGRGYDILSYQFSYLNVEDYDNIASPINGFFANNQYDIRDLEAFWARNPNRVYILWTTSLARSIGTQVAQDFNNQMRIYAQDHNMWLFDVAAIESYTDAGIPCYDNRDGILYISRRPDGTEINRENYLNDNLNLPAICQDYTTEIDGGHLGSVSGADIRLAKAFWVLMARIAGWNP